MNIVYFDALPGDKESLTAAFDGLHVSLEVVPEKLSDKNVALASGAEIISVFVSSPLTAELLNAMPALKMIAARSAGIDHIDKATCEARGIAIKNVPHYGERTVAEHAFALILALSRKIFQSYERTEKMSFDRSGLQGFDLYQKTIGIIGTGNIGANVISIAKGFGMNVIAYDVTPNQDLAKQAGFTYIDSLEKLLAQSDIITLHVPYVKATHHLINAENIKQVKKGAIIVNTARGGLIDTKALLWALESGLIAGAGLDVLEEEKDAFDRIDFLNHGQPKYDELMTLLNNHLLVSRNDVIITPHNAYNSTEAVQRIFDTTIENIKSYIAA